MKNTGIIKNYKQIDVFRFFSSILVVLIHSLNIEKFRNPFVYFDIMSVCAVAVPFFYVCTGYFLFGKLRFENNRIKSCAENKAVFIKFEKNIIITYILWSVFYIALSLANAFTDGSEAFAAYIRKIPSDFLLNGSYVHMWYVICLIYAVPIMYFLFKKISINFIYALAAVFYLCGILAGSYGFIDSGFIRALCSVSSFAGYGFQVFGRAIPFLGIGMLLSRREYIHSKNICLMLSALFFAAGYCENRLIRLYCDENFINIRYNTFLPLTMFFLFEFLLKSGGGICGKIKNTVHLRKISSIIYYFHPCVIIALNRILLTINPELTALSGTVYFFIMTAVISAAASAVIYILTLKSGRLAKIIRY